MIFFLVTALINAITSIILGFFVYFKNKKADLNKIFALFCLSTAIWSGFYFAGLIFGTAKSIALLFMKALNVAAIFIPATYFHFVIIFLDIYQKKKKLVILGYLISVFLFISGFTSLFVKDIEPNFLIPWYPKVGITYHLFALMFFSFVIYSWYLMFKAVKKATGITKLQIKYVLLGTLIGFIGGSTNFFPVYNIPIPPLGNALIVIYVIFITYAILKHHLMNIRVIATELFTGLIIVTLLIYTVFSPSLQEFLIRGSIFLAVTIFGIFLIRGTLREIESLERVAVQERALRQRAEKLAKEFERLDRAKTQFVLATQHHLRTPLSIVKGYSSMLLEGSYGKLEEKVQKVILGINEAIERLIKLVNEFLDISQLQVGREILKKEETQIEKIIEEIVGELKPVAKEKGIYLKFEAPKDLPKIILDQSKIKTAIFNVIDNGIKYTSQGGVTIKCQFPNEKCLIIVADTGIGLSQEENKTLFTKYFERGKEAEKVYTTGRGIGLYITKNIVEAHQGKIWAESEGKGKGSTFYIELPLE